MVLPSVQNFTGFVSGFYAPMKTFAWRELQHLVVSRMSHFIRRTVMALGATPYGKLRAKHALSRNRRLPDNASRNSRVVSIPARSKNLRCSRLITTGMFKLLFGLHLDVYLRGTPH